MTVTTPVFSDVLNALAGLADEAFETADRVQAAVLGALPKGSATRADLAAVEPVARAAIAAPGSRIQGAGFVAAAGLLVQDHWWLEWFVAEDDGRIERLEVETDPYAMGFHDYEQLAWYVGPRGSGQRHITGPYVDNLCTEDYTLTFTQPVTVDGAFIGVAGADIGVRAAERTLLPVLRRSPNPMAVVNSDGRVLVGNNGSLVVGELVPDTATHAEDLPGLPWRVLGWG